jgi:hypothetical protein
MTDSQGQGLAERDTPAPTVGEDGTLQAISVDRELIPLQKAQTLSKSNTFRLFLVLALVSSCWERQRYKQTWPCTVHCRMLLSSMVLVRKCVALLAVRGEEATKRHHRTLCAPRPDSPGQQCRCASFVPHPLVHRLLHALEPIISPSPARLRSTCSSTGLLIISVFADARWSAVGFAIVSPVFLAWMLTFTVGYDRVFSLEFLKRMDATSLDLRAAGWIF